MLRYGMSLLAWTSFASLYVSTTISRKLVDAWRILRCFSHSLLQTCIFDTSCLSSAAGMQSNKRTCHPLPASSPDNMVCSPKALPSSRMISKDREERRMSETMVLAKPCSFLASAKVFYATIIKKAQRALRYVLCFFA
jgi:hypothetical protein